MAKPNLNDLQQKGMSPDDVQAVSLEGGDRLCEAVVVLERVEVDGD